MICGSCRRPCDPNRSFCTHCGSSVFIDARDEASFFGRPAPRLSRRPSESRHIKALQQSVPSLGSAVTDAAKRLRARKVPASTAGVPFLPGTVIKVAIVVFLVWYTAGWLLRVPEVRVLKEAFQRGEVTDDVVRAAGDALIVRLNDAFGRRPAPSGTPQSTPVQASRATAVERPRNAPALPTDGPSAGPVFAPPETVPLPPGVSRPGNEVTMPRVLHQVKAAYTPEALRAKIEGTVVLQAVVRTNGGVSNVAVLRSLDARFGLDQQAISAVRQWRFVPGQRLGQPVPVLVRIDIRFSTK
jgi:TonB family protein